MPRGNVCGFASSSATTLDNTADWLKKSLWVVAEGIPLLLLCTSRMWNVVSFVGRKKQAHLHCSLGFATLFVTHHQSMSIQEGESFVAANSAAVKSISSDDFFNVPPRLPVKRLLAACLWVAPEEMTMMMRPRSQIQTRTWHQQDQDYVLEVEYWQLQVWEHQWLSLFVDH